MHFLTAAVVVLVVVVWKVPWRDILGRIPTSDQMLPALKITVFLWVFSVAAAYVLFIPLSFVAPSFVQWWYLDIPSLIYFEDNQYPIAQNVLGFVSVVLIVPVLEELMFRGVLLRRWAQKWDKRKAIIFSSLVFGLLHADPIGAFAFGVGMCVLYLKTQSLFVPILCHAFNNLIAFLMEIGSVCLNGPNYEYTLDDLQSEWVIAIIFVIYSVAWGQKLFAAGWNSSEWKFLTS
jgi:membrane protease YdiL (CAAX protease family)